MFAPDKTRVPALVLIKLAEVPLRTPERVRVSEVSMSKVLVPEAAKLTALLEENVLEAFRTAPSPKAKLPVPRLLSAETLRIPAEMVVAAV